MCLEWKKYFLYLAAAGLCFSYRTVVALEFKPGVGVGLEYTDNSKLTPDNVEEDVIAIASVNASIAENEGPLKYTGAASVSKQNYTKDTFEDQRYLNLLTSADWEMIRNRFHWTLSDEFTQRSITALNTNTPDNLQDSNVFTFGANILFPISARQRFSIIPTYSQYYFEVADTNNKQYALTANWNYQLYRLTNVGFNLSAREINYTEENSFGISPPNTTFKNVAVVVTGERVSSKYKINLGATNVQRDDDEEFTGFTGGVFWDVNVSSRSVFNAKVSSEITDAGSASSTAVGNNDDVQVVADVVRDSVFYVGYSREDVELRSNIWLEYRKSLYSNSPFDQIVRTTGVQLDFPGTPLFSSNISARYKQSERLDTNRLDDTFVVGGGFVYKLSRKVQGTFDLQYLTKESSLGSENYNEFSVFLSLSYGYGGVSRSSRGNSL